MPTNTRPIRKVKAEEEDNSRQVGCSPNGSASLSLASVDKIGLRRSVRETPSKNQNYPTPSKRPNNPTPLKRPNNPAPLKNQNNPSPSRKQYNSSPSSMRRSHRLGNRTPSTPFSKIKAEERGEPSSLRSVKYTSSPSSEKLEKSLTAVDLENNSRKRKRNTDDSSLKVDQFDDHGKRESTSSIDRKKLSDARYYRVLFKEVTKSGDCSYCAHSSPGKIQDKDKNYENYVTKLGTDYNDRTGNDKGKLDFDLKEAASSKFIEQGNMEISDPAMDHSCRVEFHKREGGYCVKGLENRTSKLYDAQLPNLKSKEHNLVTEACEVLANRNICTQTSDCSATLLTKCGVSYPVETPDICSERLREGDVAQVNSGYFDGASVNGDSEPVNQPLEGHLDREQNICVICKLPEKLLCCVGKGCSTKYHPACLDPSFSSFCPGGWYCCWCIKKKIESGVYSVSEGIESIWDVREVDFQNGEVMEKQKQYFVKYKGLAHVHNIWMDQSQLCGENPELLAKFLQEEEPIHWRPEWAVPHRLLSKRLVMIPKSDREASEVGGDIDCQYEWLVKWCGLDYNQVTWEFETASLLQHPQGHDLIEEYKIRHEKSRMVKEANERQGKRSGSLIKLLKLQTDCDGSSFTTVNMLYEYWRTGRNVVVIDDQDQIRRIVYLIYSLQSGVSQPYLIITPSGMLYKWEAEFRQLAPSLNIVVYSGDRHAREIIRTLEFYGEDNHVMFQVLLSTHDATAEDMDSLKPIKWEAVLVDECHDPYILAHSFFVKQLATDWTLLLMNSQIKEDVTNYYNVLSLLSHDGCPAVDCVQDHSSVNIVQLKESLSQFIVHGCKSDVSRFSEYWVPAEVSNVQLEQYCFLLLSHSAALRSKNDPLAVLPNILIAVQKCCDHPYIVDQTLQKSMIEGYVAEFVDIGTEASGKLRILSAILSKVKDLRQKVLVLFQSVRGSGRDSLGDILDDFIRLRFGADSYERTDGLELSSKKQAALNRFNNDSGRFVFLLDARACSSSLKLRSVDAVIIYNSDWNPPNDLKALQKIKMDSNVEPINVFRLYTSYTIEEKVLMLSKRNMVLDSTLQAVSWNSSQMLLMWGALYLFKKLDEFHSSDSASKRADILPRDSIYKGVLHELSSILEKHCGTTQYMFISKALQKGGVYSIDISLVGEQNFHLKDEELPQAFWEKLLVGRQPCWRFLPLSTSRSRKRVQYSDNILLENVQNNEAVKKHKVVGSSKVGLSGPKSGEVTEKIVLNETSKTAVKSNLKNDISSVSVGKQRWRDQQKDLYQLVKPVLLKLFGILGLQEDVKEMAERFLEYVTNNHHVTREPETNLQAFQISLCWVAASLLNQDIDQKHSLVLARERLNFTCTDEDAFYSSDKMRSLKGLFLRSLKVTCSPKDPVSGNNRVAKEGDAGNALQPVLFEPQKMTDKINAQLIDQRCSDTEVLSSSTCAEKDMSKSMRKIHKQIERLLKNQAEEEIEFTKHWEEKKAELAKEYSIEKALIHAINSTTVAVQVDKLRELENCFRKKCKELDSEMADRLKDLKASHFSEQALEEKRAACSLENLKSQWLDKPASAEGAVIVEKSQDNREQGIGDNTSLAPGNLQTEKNVAGGTCSIHKVVPQISEDDRLMWEAESSEMPLLHADKLPSVEGGDNVEKLQDNQEQRVVDTTCLAPGDLQTEQNAASGTSNTCSVQKELIHKEPHHIFVEKSQDNREQGIGDNTSLVPGNLQTELNAAGVTSNTCSIWKEQPQISDSYRLMWESESSEVPLHPVDKLPLAEGGVIMGKSQDNQEQQVVDPTFSAQGNLQTEQNVPGVTSNTCSVQKELIQKEPLPIFVEKSQNNREQGVGDDTSMLHGNLQIELNAAGVTSNTCTTQKEPPQISEADKLIWEAESSEENLPSAQGGVIVEKLQDKQEERVVDATYLAPGNNLTEQNVAGVTANTCFIQKELHQNFEVNRLMREPESSEKPLLPLDLSASDKDNSNVLPKPQTNEILSSMDATLDRVEVVRPSSSSDKVDFVPPDRSAAIGVERHVESSHPLSTGDLITDEEAIVPLVETVSSGQVAAAEQCDGTTTSVGIGSTVNRLVTASFSPMQSQLNSSQANSESTSQDRAILPVEVNVVNNQQVCAEAVPLSAGCVVQPEASPCTSAEMPNTSHCEAVRSMHTVDHTSERIQPNLPSSSGPHNQRAPDDLSVLQTRHIADQLFTSTSTNPSQAGHHVLAPRSISSISEVRGCYNPVALPLPIPIADPLQNMMERVRKDIDQTTKNRDEEVSRLIVEREKEVEEMLAQIQKKYDLKIQEAEASYLQKTKELHDKQVKIYMNKILADAFRSKCLDSRAAPVMRQAGPSRFIQQTNPCSSPLTSSSTVITTTRSAASPAPGPVRSAAPPTTRSVNHTRAHAASASGLNPPIPMRTPQISPLIPSTGPHHLPVNVRSGVHSSSHLQHFRPAASDPRSLPSPTILRQPIIGSLRPSQPSTPPPATATKLPSPVSGSATQPVMNVGNQSRPPTHTLPPLSDIARHHNPYVGGGPLNCSGDVLAHTQQQQQQLEAGACVEGVVCLSDDE